MWAINARRGRALAPLLASLLLLCACAGAETGGAAGDYLSAAADVRQTTYNTQTIRREDVLREADLHAESSYRLAKAVKTDGGRYTLKEMKVGRGQRVEAGEVVAVLQGMGLAADAEQRALELAAFEAGFVETRAVYESAVAAAEALPAGTPAQARLRELRTEYAQTELALYVLQAEHTRAGMEETVAAARAETGEFYLYAPVSGPVHSVNTRCKPGDALPAYTELASVYDESSLLLYANSASGQFVYGREVRVSTGRGERAATYTGRVVSAPELTPPQYYSTAIFVRLEGENLPAQDFDADMRVQYPVLKNAIVIPKSAVGTEEGVAYVTLLNDGAVRQRSIVRGPSVGTGVAVLLGLEEGDELVVSSYNVKSGGGGE